MEPKCKLVTLADGMVILGLDPPAFRNGGWGAIRYSGGKSELLAKFTQVIEREEADMGRLRDIYDQTRTNILAYKPSMLCVERSAGGGMRFVRNNLSEAVGVVKLCCHDMGVPVWEISPGTLKLHIAGHGHAGKPFIKKNIKEWFGLAKTGVEHECDAVAFALCGLICLGWDGYAPKVPFVGKPKKPKSKGKRPDPVVNQGEDIGAENESC